MSLCLMNGFAQGLGFHGMEYKIDERTSYDVFGGYPQRFDDSFRMEFELYTEPSSEFGYFFRIKDKYNTNRIWNLSYDSRGDSIVVRLNEEGRHSLIKAQIPHSSLSHLQWHPVRIEFDLVRDSVNFEIADYHYACKFNDLPDSVQPEIEFGRSGHIIDVPSFSVRELHIGDDRRSFYFPLDQKDGGIVYDSSHKVCGKVVNPDWLIRRSLSWRRNCSLSYEDIAGSAYNPVRKEFYYFTRYNMTRISLLDDSVMDFEFATPCPVHMKLGNNFVSQDGGKLYCYELYDDEADEGCPSVASLDLDTFVWKVESDARLNMPMHHHGCFFNPSTGDYTVLGGFGDMLYNGHFYRYDIAGHRWVEEWDDAGGDTIFPRYFTSTGTDGKYVYVYGGMGNECGEQVVGRKYFYDLHRVEPVTGKSTLLWNLDWKDEDKVPVRNLIVDGDCFYTLCYPEYVGNSELKLYKFNIADGSHEVLADSIPIVSDKMRTNANIVFDSDLGMFYALVQVFDDDIRSTLDIYELSYPPLSEHMLDTGCMPWGWICAAMALLVCAGILLLSYRKMHGSKAGVFAGQAGRKVFRYERKPNSISLFGDLTVTDRGGQDVTSQFTKQQIIILCLLIKRGEQGMSSRRLSNILWPDKEEDKVKNSRGVAINGLRKSLAMLDDVAVNFRDGRFYLDFGPEGTCDWLEMRSILKSRSQGMEGALDILSQGKFLKSITLDLFDDFKEEVENMLLPILLEELEKRFKAREYEAVCEIGEMIWSIDPTNEDSLRIVVRALRLLRRSEESLMKYAAFCAEYKKNNGMDYPIPYRSI